ncbi:MAG: hypothetical protein NVS9B4_27860 [Candidatus Acidiferrum sp.]
MKRVSFVFTLAVLFLSVTFSTLGQQDPALGTWKLNLEKSKYGVGLPPKSLTRTVEAAGDGLKLTYDGVRDDGAPMAFTFTIKPDGTESPITGSGVPGEADTISSKRVNSHTYASTLKKAGKVVQTSRTVYSHDGKVATLTATVHDKDGKTGKNVLIFEKQ